MSDDQPKDPPRPPGLAREKTVLGVAPPPQRQSDKTSLGVAPPPLPKSERTILGVAPGPTQQAEKTTMGVAPPPRTEQAGPNDPLPNQTIDVQKLVAEVSVAFDLNRPKAPEMPALFAPEPEPTPEPALEPAPEPMPEPALEPAEPEPVAVAAEPSAPRFSPESDSSIQPAGVPGSKRRRVSYSDGDSSIHPAGVPRSSLGKKLFVVVVLGVVAAAAYHERERLPGYFARVKGVAVSPEAPSAAPSTSGSTGSVQDEAGTTAVAEHDAEAASTPITATAATDSAPDAGSAKDAGTKDAGHHDAGAHGAHLDAGAHHDAGKHGHDAGKNTHIKLPGTHPGGHN